jgi:hypothetical protein
LLRDFEFILDVDWKRRESALQNAALVPGKVIRKSRNEKAESG